MRPYRRHFLTQSLSLLAAPALVSGAPAGMPHIVPHIVLLGDSIFDNDAYTNGKPDVVTHLRRALAPGSACFVGI
jgi:hypothetical protein